MDVTTSKAAPAKETAPLDHAAIRTILLGIMVAMFLGALDQTIIATALPTIARVFGNVEGLSWVVTAYLLTSTAATPLYGKLADMYGPRIMLMVAIVLFSIGSVVAALAPSMLVLILARGLQGLGGGGLISLAQTIIGIIIPPRERGRYQGYIAAVFITSSVAGPVLGGFFAEHLHWSLIFWINLPLGLMAVAMTDRALRRLPVHGHRHSLDFVGAIVMCAATIALLLALTWGGTRYAWTSFEVLGLIAISAVLWLLFALRLATALEPLLPTTILLNSVVLAGVVAAAFAMGTMIGLSIQLPIYLELVKGLSASASGLVLIPLMAGVVIGATIVGRYMGRITHYKRMPMVGLSLAIVTLAMLAIDPAGMPISGIVALLGLVGVGLGSVLPITTVAIQNAVPTHQIGTATAVMNFFRSLGSAILVAGFGAIVLGFTGIAGSEHGMSGAATLVGGEDIASAFRWVFIAASLALAASLAAVLAMEERPLRTTAAAASVVVD